MVYLVRADGSRLCSEQLSTELTSAQKKLCFDGLRPYYCVFYKPIGDFTPHALNLYCTNSELDEPS